MKCSDFKTFEKEKSSLYLLLSKEDFPKNLTLKRFKKGLKFSADRLKSLDPVLEELQSRSLFTDSKTIIITEIDAQKVSFFDDLLPFLRKSAKRDGYCSHWKDPLKSYQSLQNMRR